MREMYQVSHTSLILPYQLLNVRILYRVIYTTLCMCNINVVHFSCVRQPTVSLGIVNVE